MVLEVIFRDELYDSLYPILNSAVAQNIFIALPESQKYEFVRHLHHQYSQNEDTLLYVRNALSQKFYAPYLLMQLIDRDQYKKITNFEPFERCIQTVTSSELNELS